MTSICFWSGNILMVTNTSNVYKSIQIQFIVERSPFNEKVRKG